MNGPLFIDGKWQSASGSIFTSICPVDDSIVWQNHAAARREVDLAFAAARTAFPAWWDLKADQRIGFCQRFAELVSNNSEELAELIARETGKPIWEARTEAAAVAGKIALSIEAYRNRRDTTSFDMAGTLAVTRFKPHGVCVVLGPFNFPAHLPNGHIVPALIAGNTIVFKPSEITPAVGQWMCQQWEAAGLPVGVFNLLQGGRETGETITSHPELDGLFFTGSSKVGKALHRAFADHPQKILALEMGGNNPLVVHKVRDLRAAAYATILSAYFTAGQRCTCARRLILIDDEEGRRYLQTLIEMIRKVTVGFYNDQPQPFMGTVISGAMGRTILGAQTTLVEQGGIPLVEMKSLRNCDALISPGLIDVTHVSNRSDEELFGPLLNVIRVSSFSSAIDEANRSSYGLSAGLLSDERELYETFIHRIRAGIVNWNRQTTGATGKLPFGGCGQSGNHRPSAYFAADYCSFPVASLEASELKMPEKLETGLQFTP
jgi:succinylglutamic semialdehyde dehydrogenase